MHPALTMVLFTCCQHHSSRATQLVDSPGGLRLLAHLLACTCEPGAPSGAGGAEWLRFLVAHVCSGARFHVSMTALGALDPDGDAHRGRLLRVLAEAVEQGCVVPGGAVVPDDDPPLRAGLIGMDAEAEGLLVTILDEAARACASAMRSGTVVPPSSSACLEGALCLLRAVAGRDMPSLADSEPSQGAYNACFLSLCYALLTAPLQAA